jgi:hypothetical protein
MSPFYRRTIFIRRQCQITKYPNEGATSAQNILRHFERQIEGDLGRYFSSFRFCCHMRLTMGACLSKFVRT